MFGRRVLQSLLGKMQWASRVVFGGRVFMRSCSDALSHVLHPGFHVSVSSPMRDDLRWWLQSATAHNGVVSLAPARVTHYLFIDACLSPVPCIGVFSAGAFLSLDAGQLLAMGLDPPAVTDDINVWECFAVLVAVMCFGVTMTPAIRELQAEVVTLQAGALADATKRNYAYYELWWVRFLLVFNLLAFVAAPTEAVVCLYVAFLARTNSYGSVKNCLKGLQRFLLERGWPGHFSRFWGLQQCLAGLRRASKAVQRKLPITPFILMRVLRVVCVTSPVELMVFAAMLIAFAAFLRKANVCAASRSLSHVQRSLLRRDVVVDRAQYCLFVTLRFMKNSQYQDSTHTVVVAGRKGHPLDPVAWWCTYVALVPAPQEAAAFGYTSEGVYVPLVHTEFVTWVKRLLSCAGFDSSQYAGHSFRRGAATFSFLVGLPDLLVKEMGAWRSQVYQVYMDMSLSQKLSVHSTWFDAMAAGQLGGELVPPS
ncbi:hypothetical protein OEZ85_000028 [Tetradesmus obliquus]|uniref:Tyr recombinase domain-containing protein n=1 Tax=Tetradesmus obliquus TaxID=3088 RepID=A0ABY8UNW8_TETOB|nr:hypothetical protein OEZ85_000028 [Tetradesmus obliquus]